MWGQRGFVKKKKRESWESSVGVWGNGWAGKKNAEGGGEFERGTYGKKKVRQKSRKTEGPKGGTQPRCLKEGGGGEPKVKRGW